MTRKKEKEQEECTEMKVLSKWDYDSKKYEDHKVPEDWNVSLYEKDLSNIINCAECGEQIEFGDAYTSATIHNDYGLGFSICFGCHEEEFEEIRRRSEVY
jgi:hypothetical protein